MTTNKSAIPAEEQIRRHNDGPCLNLRHEMSREAGWDTGERGFVLEAALFFASVLVKQSGPHGSHPSQHQTLLTSAGCFVLIRNSQRISTDAYQIQGGDKKATRATVTLLLSVMQKETGEVAAAFPPHLYLCFPCGEGEKSSSFVTSN